MKQKTLFDEQIEKTDRILNNLNVQYLIITPDGHRFGNIESMPQKKRSFKYKWGELKTYISPFLTELLTGIEICVPYNNYDKDRLSGAICGYASDNWGVGSYTYKCKKDGIHIMRLL